MNRTWDTGEAAYTGAALDSSSRKAVRSVITKAFTTGTDPNWFKLVSLMDRDALVIRCARAVESYWEERPEGGARASWSYQAVAEEVDFYLPKVVGACLRDAGPAGLARRHAPYRTLIDPYTEPFCNWSFDFPQTRERLARERVRSGFAGAAGGRR